MRKHLLSVCLVAMLALPAAAATPPAEIAPVIKSQSAYGSGALSRLMFTAYDATLWTDAPRWTYDAPFALTLTYRMGFTTDELVERSIEEMERGGALKPEEKSRYAQILTAAFPDVNDGDRITALFSPNAGLAFFHNGKHTKTVAAIGFAKRFMNIWLGENTSEPSLRRALLGRQ